MGRPLFQRVYMLNRMMLAVSSRVAALIEGVAGVPAETAEYVDELPEGGVDLLVVGRQHRSDEGITYGFDIVEAAVERARPAALVYVLPGEFDGENFARDLEALMRIQGRTAVHVLAFPTLQSLETDVAVARAAPVLGRPVFGRVRWLLDDSAEP